MGLSHNTMVGILKKNTIRYFSAALFIGSMLCVSFAEEENPAPPPVSPFLEQSFWEDASSVKIKVLLKKGFSLDVENAYGLTPLFYALKDATELDIIKTIIDNSKTLKKASPNSITPLMLAAQSVKNPEIIKLMIKRGSDINKTATDNRTAFLYAVFKNKNPEIVKILVQAGSNINQRDSKGWNALDYIIKDENRKPLESDIYVTELLQRKIIKEYKTYQNTVLYLSEAETLQYIHKNIKSNTEKTDTTGDTFLLAAAAGKYSSVITELCKMGADIKATTIDDLTPLMVAASYGSNPDIISAIMQCGAKINTATPQGWTALLFASYLNPNPKILTRILSYNPDIHLKNKKGYDALYLMKQNKSLFRTKIYWRFNQLYYKTKQKSNTYMKPRTSDLDLDMDTSQ